MNVDVIDLKILKALQRDGRISNLKLAETVCLSPSACLRRVGLLEESGIIRGYTAQLDAGMLGLEVEAFVMITMRRDADRWHEQFAAALQHLDEVIGSYVVTGEANYLLRVRTRNLKHYSDFVLEKIYKIPGVLDIRSYMVLQTMRENAVIGEPPASTKG
ncbi:Lrp/AsnC family transcriptional regulator, leucine-responsive regulatory protein [Janthinobacterium sp. CG_23.3]|uniref:Lrp/AsnC family transcriptional regulator n=1 Tax=unclassified Janthinobacterium TaxID=2610881 RepID=UPI00034708EA|nr:MULTISPECIES: Lrp/AsnC family transcriptional regulator [unclassified Janthinobacterium]MEC5159376.1 Lrp/AsnC family leucine-responsive transcriptional regulator [Janthinobacterium sp. CG_S6]